MQLDRPRRQQHIRISWSFWRCKLRDNNMPAFYYMNTRTEYILPGVFGFQPLKIKQNLLVIHNHRLSVYENCELFDETKHLHLLYFIFRSFCHDTIEYHSLIYFLAPTEVPSTRLALIRSSWRDRNVALLRNRAFLLCNIKGKGFTNSKKTYKSTFTPPFSVLN